MKSAVRNVLFLIIILFSISYDSFTLGVEYDKKHKLYPEFYFSGYVALCDYLYGKRWEGLGIVTLSLGMVSIISLIVAGAEREPVIDKRLSILPRREE